MSPWRSSRHLCDEMYALSFQRKILDILRQNQGPFIVFVNIRANCDVVNRELNRSGFRAVAIHGGKNQESRQRALRDFRDGKFPILVATDVAGRGIDVPNVKHVLNYDMPNSIEKYTHRIGRTGRAGKEGLASTFLTEDDSEIFYSLVEYLRSTKADVPSALARHPMSKVKPGDIVEKEAAETALAETGSAFGRCCACST